MVLIGFTDVITGVIKYNECCKQSDHANHGSDDGGFGWIKHVSGYKRHKQIKPPLGGIGSEETSVVVRTHGGSHR